MMANNFQPSIKGIFSRSEHGSWNRAVRVGYELIRIPLHSDRTRQRRIRGFNDWLRGRQ